MEPRWNRLAGAPGWDAGVFLDCAAARKRESGYSVCADALSAAFLPWAASAVDGRRTQPRTRLPGLFSLECRCGAALLPEGCHEGA